MDPFKGHYVYSQILTAKIVINGKTHLSQFCHGKNNVEKNLVLLLRWGINFAVIIELVFN